MPGRVQPRTRQKEKQDMQIDTSRQNRKPSPHFIFIDRPPIPQRPQEGSRFLSDMSLRELEAFLDELLLNPSRAHSAGFPSQCRHVADVFGPWWKGQNKRGWPKDSAHAFMGAF